MNFIINLYLRGVVVELSRCVTFVQPAKIFSGFVPRSMKRTLVHIHPPLASIYRKEGYIHRKTLTGFPVRSINCIVASIYRVLFMCQQQVRCPPCAGVVRHRQTNRQASASREYMQKGRRRRRCGATTPAGHHLPTTLLLQNILVVLPLASTMRLPRLLCVPCPAGPST